MGTEAGESRLRSLLESIDDEMVSKIPEPRRELIKTLKDLVKSAAHS